MFILYPEETVSLVISLWSRDQYTTRLILTIPHKEEIQVNLLCNIKEVNVWNDKFKSSVNLNQ